MPTDTQPADRTRIEDVIGFWLGPVDAEGNVPADRKQRWFKATPDFDRECRDRYLDLVQRAGRGELDHWRTSPRGTLALVILCDQLTRNIHRGRPEAFELDERALEISRGAIEAEQHHQLKTIERAFLYMPFQHAEDADTQKEGVALFTELAEHAPESIKSTIEGFRDHAQKHKEVIDRFGRFPHRNERLGRESTEEEEAYLAEGGGFG